MDYQGFIKKLDNAKFNDGLKYIYSCNDDDVLSYKKRIVNVIDGFVEKFKYEPENIRIFSAPGRTEIGGNHTDHQQGCVLAAAINLDVLAVVCENGKDEIKVISEGFEENVINLCDLEIKEKEKGTSASLIRGVARKISDLGYKLSGFDAYCVSNVLKGSGMSSSAAFEVLIGTILNGLFCENKIDAIEIAKIAQYAENVYFDKPSGLMDQMASSVGAVSLIDFFDKNNPIVKKVDYDFTKSGYSLCIIDSGADHADLTDDYAQITREMKMVAEFFGKEYLSQVDKSEFYEKLSELKSEIKNERAILRAIHYFNETKRAMNEALALLDNDFDKFLKLVSESGKSSFMYLQNIYSDKKSEKQEVSLLLALCDEILKDSGAHRVHGGGFAGTVQAFVPNDILDEFITKIEAVFGKNSCHILAIRPVGGIEIKA